MKIHTFDATGAILSTLYVTGTDMADAQVAGDVIGWLEGTDTTTAATHFVDDPEGTPVLTEKAPVPPPPATVQGLKETLAAYRYEKQEGGVEVELSPPSGTAVYQCATDERTYTMIIGVLQRRGFPDPPPFIDWKMENGEFVALDSVSFTTMAIAVGQHVQWCFSAERAVTEDIEAAADLDVLDVEAMFDTEFAALVAAAP